MQPQDCPGGADSKCQQRRTLSQFLRHKKCLIYLSQDSKTGQMSLMSPKHRTWSLFPGHEGAWPSLTLGCPFLIPKTPRDSASSFPPVSEASSHWKWGWKQGIWSLNPQPGLPLGAPSVMSGQAGEPVVWEHEIKEDGAHPRYPRTHEHPKDSTVLPCSAASCPAPMPGIAEVEPSHCQPSPKPHPWTVPAPSTVGHGGRQAPKSKRQRLASISVFTSHFRASYHYRHTIQAPARQ